MEFKFDESDALEKHIYALYNLASDWGVHGHIAGPSSLSPTAATPEGLLRLEVPDAAVYRRLENLVRGFLSPSGLVRPNVYVGQARAGFTAVQYFS